MAEDRMNEAMERLNRGIQESRRAAQQQALELAQEYFDGSVEDLKRQIKDNRAALRDLPEQIPGGQEEPFQSMFQELMDNYGKMEDALNEAKDNVANIDPEEIRRQGEVNATDAARRDARELGVDLTEVEGTGSDGRVTVDDVKEFAEAAQNGAAGDEEGLKATDAATRRAEELGIDLSQVEGTGSGGSITVGDVMSMAEGAQEQAPTGQAAQEAQDTAGQAVQGAQDAAGQAAGQVQDAVGQATDQAQDGAGRVADQAGQAAQGVQDTAGQATDRATNALGGVTDQVGQAVQGVQDTAGQATQQATGQAGQDGAEEPKATNAARRKAEELGVDLSEVQGTGAGGLITLKDVTGS